VIFAHMCEGEVPSLRLRTERVDFLFFFYHGEVGLRERDEFCKPSERREKGGPKMRGFSAVSGRPR
jgi:hypothetical protein